MNNTNETKWTPGPWTVEPNVNAGGVTHLAVTARHAGDDWMPCSISPQHQARNVDYANARLIAHAPELVQALELTLAALERVYGLHNKGGFSSIQGTVDVARALLAKIKEGK